MQWHSIKIFYKMALGERNLEEIVSKEVALNVLAIDELAFIKQFFNELAPDASL